MFADTHLRELVEFTSSSPVLSIYLNTEPSEGNADAYKLRLRTLLKEVKLPQDVEAVEHYMNREYDWSGRSVAMFSCAAKGFFRAFPLAVPVRNFVHIGSHPSIKTLADLIDNYGGYGVVLVDKQGARVFFFHMGELQEQDGLVGDPIKRAKEGGASTFLGRRGGTSAGQTQYVDELVERNMREAVDFSVHFFEENHVRRVLIGGTEDNVALYRSLLPKAWQSLVTGTFAMSMTASHAEVLNRAMQIGQENERQREARLVADLITAASKGTNAALGLEKVLPLVHAARISRLVITDGFQKPGYRCPDCGRLTLTPEKECLDCTEKPVVVADVVELMVSTVLRHGGEIEVVHSIAPLESRGHVGAWLRY